MLIVWKITYIDRKTKEFGDRTLLLDTEVLQPTQRAAVELVMKDEGVGKRG